MLCEPIMKVTRTLKLIGLALNAAWIAACGGAQPPPPTAGSCGAKATVDGGKGSCGAKGACGEKMPAEKGACGGHGGGGM